MKKGIVLPLIIILASVALILGAFFLLTDKPKPTDQRSTQQASPSPTSTSETINTDEGNANWKTYISSKWSFEFKYPADFNIYEDSTNRLSIAKNQLGTNGILVVSNLHNDYVSVNSLQPCVTVYEEIKKDPGIRPSCLELGTKFSQPKDIDTIKLGGVDVKSFYETSTGRGGTWHVIQTINPPLIQLTSTDPNETIFDQILSTFKFTDQ